MRSDEYFVRELLVSSEEAIGRIQRCIMNLGEISRGELSQLDWFDMTVAELDAVFLSGGGVYFSYNGGFSISLKIPRTVRSANLLRANGILNRIIKLIQIQELAHLPASDPASAEKVESKGLQNINLDKVFIVHGHDDLKILQVKEVLKSQNLNPIVLQDAPNGGRTIIEKFEEESNVGFAIILLTADDIGGISAAPHELRSRARQNVIFELGFFVGKLGRKRVSALVAEDVELPSDIHGVVYTVFDAGKAWRYTLIDELKHAGYSVSKDNL